MRTALTLTAVAGLAAGAAAQDSVSNSSVFAQGDALNPYAANQQVADYVVDLAPFTTSWGTEFGVAPLIKAPKTSSAFFNNLMSAQAISADVLTGVAPAASSYALWSAPGAGVNPLTNNPSGSVAAPASVSQFAVAFNSFGTNDAGFNAEVLTGGLVNFAADEPTRLFVRAVTGAVSNPNLTAGDTAALGGVSVDADGNAYLRSDSFGTSGSPAVSGVNWYRVRLDDRTATVNQISGNLATTQATDALLINAGDPHPPANNIPASAAGGNGVVVGNSFGSTYVFGAAAPLTGNSSNLAGNSGQRGTFGSTDKTPLGGVQTFAALQTSTGAAESIAVWAADASGAVIIPTLADFNLPGTLSDPTNGYSITTTNGGGAATLDGYRSQTAFRGGVGTVDVQEDQLGNLLVAGTLYENGGIPNDPANTIVVARRTSAGSVSWVAVANASVGATPRTGKEILDGPGGSPIGRLTNLFDVTGGNPAGPSLSQPAFDSAGNVWFIAAVALDKVDPITGPFIDTDSALIRAVYNPASFTYELELVLELGDVFSGPNSGVPYQIQFLGVADSNSIDSGTIFGSNVSSQPWNNIDISDLDTADPRTNGGVVIRAEIVYDKDGDGDFQDPTGGNSDPTSLDESYATLLYVGNITPAPAGPMGCNIADLALPFNSLTFADISAFLGAFAANDPIADLAPPFGSFTFADISAFLGAFAAGCP